METPTNSEINATEAPEYGEHYGAVAHVILTRSALRLCWTLNGPLTTSISVMANTYTSDLPNEPYYQPTTNPNSAETSESQWHPIFSDPLTKPPISSIIVNVEPLSEWEENWVELHRDHSIPPGAPKPDYTVDFDPDEAQYGALPDQDTSAGLDDEWPEADGPGSGHLLKCCGSTRPRKTMARGRLLVTIKARTGGVGSGTSSGPGYLTVHDYVEQIHPWLMGLREDILEARAVVKALLCEGPEEFTREEILERDKDEKLFVDGVNIPHIRVCDEEEWMGYRPQAA